jgi:hypothetical protein
MQCELLIQIRTSTSSRTAAAQPTLSSSILYTIYTLRCYQYTDLTCIYLTALVHHIRCANITNTKQSSSTTTWCLTNLLLLQVESFNDTCPNCAAKTMTHTMNVFCALVQWHQQGKTEIPEDKPITATLGPPQASHRLNLDWTWPGRLEIRKYPCSFLYQMLHNRATIMREEMAINSVPKNTV